MRWATLGAALLLGFLPGCLTAPETPDALPESNDRPTEPALQPPLATGRNCSLGGGHSVHPYPHPLGFQLPEPWRPADVLDDVGPQVVYSEVPSIEDPIPTQGRTMGNLHATMVCEAWTVNGIPGPLVFGFVGMKVEPPPFAPAGAHHDYLVTVVAADEPQMVNALHGAGIHATLGTGGLDSDAVGAHSLLDTEHHGVYETYFRPTPFSEIPQGVTRLWFQHENANGTFSPVALEIANAPAQHSIAQGPATFTHQRTEDHSPVPGAYGQTAAMLWDGFDAEIRLGASPVVVLDEAYVHA